MTEEYDKLDEVSLTAPNNIDSYSSEKDSNDKNETMVKFNSDVIKEIQNILVEDENRYKSHRFRIEPEDFYIHLQTPVEWQNINKSKLDSLKDGICDALRKRLTSYFNHVNKMDNEVHVNKGTIINLNDSLKEAKTKLEKYNKHKKGYYDSSDEDRDRFRSVAEKKLQRAFMDVRDLEETVEELESQKMKDRSKVNKLTNELNDLKTEFEDLESENSKLKSEIKKMKKAAKKKVHSDSDDDDYKEDLKAKDKEIKKLKNIKMELQSKLDEMNELQQNTELCDSTELENLKDERDKLQRELEETKSQLTISEADKEKLKKGIQEIKNKVQRCSEENRQLQEEVKTLTEELKKSETERNSSKTEIEKKQKAIETMKNKLKTKLVENDVEELKKLRNEVKHLKENRIKDLESEIDVQKKSLSAKDEEVQKSVRDYNNLKLEFENLKKLVKDDPK